MSQYSRRESFSGPFAASRPENDIDTDLVWPFTPLHGLSPDDVRETAYELFFTACRCSGAKNNSNANNNNNANISPSSNDHGCDGGSGFGAVSPTGSRGGHGSGNMATVSKVKRALGLKMIKRSPTKRMTGGFTSAPTSPNVHNHSSYSSSSSGFGSVSGGGSTPTRARRPMTSAEIMRQQMKVAEQTDNRLRKILSRILVGQTGRRAETITLPLELLRHLKPGEFNNIHEYHTWQKRQLKILEAGLLLHPSIPLEKSNTFAARFREILRASDAKHVDTSKSSDTMRSLCNAVVSLVWRSTNNAPADVCHWADGFPLNIHLYCSLLSSIFDSRDETLVLDELDELLELMKKTWSTLGVNRQVHNVCFTWILFQQYVSTSQLEPDLLCASLAMLSEVASDAKRPDRDANYVKLLSAVLSSMQSWSEKKLLRYHDYFQRGTIGMIENLLPLALSASKILGEDVTITGQSPVAPKQDKGDTMVVDISGDRINYYIRSSIKNAFTKVLESGNISTSMAEINQESSEALMQLAKETEDLALKERECFTPILKKWHPVSAGVAAATLHSCYGTVLKQYLGTVDTLTTETVAVLQRAGRLEKVMVQMVVEDTVDCEDGGKGIVSEMAPYEVDLVIMDLLKQWIEDRLKMGRYSLNRAKETETWNPKSKDEPYAQSAVEIVEQTKETVQEFFEIPIGITDDLVKELAQGLELLFHDFITFVSSCGSKQSYVPTLPPLTRCNRDSKFFKLWRKAAPCSTLLHEDRTVTNNLQNSPAAAQETRSITSRGTQRLYIRLNTLHYLHSELQTIEKALSSQSPASIRRTANNRSRHGNSSTTQHFENCHRLIDSASHQISEVAAYRLVFLDSSPVLYDRLYAGQVAGSRVKPALEILRQSLALLTAMVTDRAQAGAMREVMKACFECFLTILLAGGPSRVFQRSDHEIVVEDFQSLKRVFCACGEGLISEDMVDREAEAAEGVIALMGQATEQLTEEFAAVSGEAGAGRKVAVPPTTGRWSRTDPNTILRVLCYRDEKAANVFLKKTFQLAKRK